MKRTLLLATITIVFSSCARPLLVTTDVVAVKPVRSESDITVVDSLKLPAEAELIGSVYVGDNGGHTRARDCSFNKVFERTLIEAHNMGGNYLVIRKHTEPDRRHFEPCHALCSDVYFVK